MFDASVNQNSNTNSTHAPEKNTYRIPHLISSGIAGKPDLLTNAKDYFVFCIV